MACPSATFSSPAWPAQESGHGLGEWHTNHELFAAYLNNKHFVRLIAKPLPSRLKLEGVESDLIQGTSHNLSHSPAWPAQVRGHGRGEWPTIHELFASVSERQVLRTSYRKALAIDT
jgi:hypothetical protein